MARIDLGYTNMYYRNPIVHLVFEENIELGFPEIREIIKHAETLSNHKPHLILAEILAEVSITQEGKRLAYKKEEAPLHKGTAVVVRNKLLPLAVALFNASPAPEYPCRVFTDREQAFNWLSGVHLDN
jgi:hypothetical protein